MGAHDGMQKWVDSYWETYSTLVNIFSVCLILAFKKIHKLESKAIDFVLSFSQAYLKDYIWMNLKICFQVDGQTKANYDRHYVLKLDKNLYGLKQGMLKWYEKLKTSLVNRNFKTSDIDPCLLIRNGIIVLTYVDDCIIVGPYMQNIDTFVKSMEVGPKHFSLNNEGDIDKFLGIEIKYLDGKIFKIPSLF